MDEPYYEVMVGEYNVAVPDGPKWAARNSGGQWERLSEGGMSWRFLHT